MANNSGGSSFIENLPKIYGMYTGGFLVFVLLMAILEQMGLGADTIGILFVAFTIVIYAAIGWLSRTMAVDAYYVAGRQVPAVFNGMATAADWMSGASFVAMAGGIYFGGSRQTGTTLQCFNGVFGEFQAGTGVVPINLDGFDLLSLI